MPPLRSLRGLHSPRSHRRLRRLTQATLATAAATAVLLGTASCGAQGTDAAAGSGDGSSTATRMVTDVDGKQVEVPEHPTRVVTLSEPTTDAALALGIKPVGIVAGRGQSTASNYLAEEAKGIEIMGTVGTPNFEAIGKAEPDLILVDGTSVNNDQATLDTLEHIAPVVYTGYAGGAWRPNLEITADALNAKDAGQKIEDDYDARVKDLGAQLKSAGLTSKTFSIIRWQGTAPSLILKELLPGQALTDLGLKRPASQDKEGRGHSEPVSLENLDTIDADYLFFGTLGGSSVSNPAAGGAADDAAAEEAIATAEATPGFTELSAVKQGHVIPVDGSVWTSTGGPLLMSRILDDIQSTLLEN